MLRGLWALLAILFFARAAADTALDLGAAADYSIVAASTITNVGATEISGNVGLYPGTSVTGFESATHTGQTDVANPAALAAQKALTLAYVTAADKAADTILSADLGGMTLAPGIYKFAAAAELNGVLTLDGQGDPNAVWTFQIGSSILFAGTSQVVFGDGEGNANHVTWVVGSAATIMNGVTVVGNILAFFDITLTIGSTVHGRLLSRNAAVTLIGDYINIPLEPTAAPTAAPTSQPSAQPTGEPSGQPTGKPSGQPSSLPTAITAQQQPFSTAINAA
ncbi:hypothetical protein B484DRAFT_397166 [Ochromonadaceae sp. CCMP2298]|nr:hypothetical protein B484DRAFT_397166 [Ochromonadaceae sp. CCMP2298]